MTNFLSKIFSYTKSETRVVYSFLGIKLNTKNPEFTKNQIKIQDSYDLNELHNAKKLVVFLVPGKRIISGGILSIFSLCKTTRELYPDICSVITTFPGKKTYAYNNLFRNNEKVYRWEQILKNAPNIKNLIIHIPEYLCKDFYTALTKSDIQHLKKIEKLQINILNQNIDMMPERSKLSSLYNLTSNITQTIAHDKNATQEICNKWNMPTHLLSANFEIEGYKAYRFEEKEKIIVISPDSCTYKKQIIKKLKKEFPDYQFITVFKMKFEDYMDLISRAYFSITFGEGFDGYFLMPPIVKSLGFAVYNDHFFPDSSWKSIKTVYSSYQEMFDKIVNDIKTLSSNKEEYIKTYELIKKKHDELYSTNKFRDNLERFYKQQYDLLPTNLQGEKY